jgi:hypothetical protein
MFRILFAMLLTFMVSGLAQGQSPTICKLNVAESPSIHGVKLGMTADELYALFPGALSPGTATEQDFRITIGRAAGPPNFGVANVNIAPSRFSNKDTFNDLETYSLVLFDRRIVKFTAYYRGPQSSPRGAAWPRLDELLIKFSEAYHLPSPSSWVDDGASKLLRCNGFEVQVSYPNDRAQLVIGLSPPVWIDESKKRHADEEERLRRAFKP